MLHVQLGVGLSEALSRLRAYACAYDRDLDDVAEDVIARRILIERTRERPGLAAPGKEPRAMIAAERLAEAFVEVADTLVDDFDLIEFLQMLVVRTSALFEVSAAGLLLADHRGRLQLMAASDERSHLLELFQVQTDEGPCRDCFHHGRAVVNADLDQASDTWPRFAPRAVAAGYRAVHAFPLRLRRDTIGALNLFSTDVGQMAVADAGLVQALADVATIGLLQERAIQRGNVLAEQLQAALNSRIVIEQAKGALAQMHACRVDEAFEMMRSYARKHNMRLGEVARSVTADPDSVRDLTTAPGAVADE